MKRPDYQHRRLPEHTICPKGLLISLKIKMMISYYSNQKFTQGNTQNVSAHMGCSAKIRSGASEKPSVIRKEAGKRLQGSTVLLSAISPTWAHQHPYTIASTLMGHSNSIRTLNEELARPEIRYHFLPPEFTAFYDIALLTIGNPMFFIDWRNRTNRYSVAENHQEPLGDFDHVVAR
jgi:hypothetical protein